MTLLPTRAWIESLTTSKNYDLLDAGVVQLVLRAEGVVTPRWRVGDPAQAALLLRAVLQAQLRALVPR